MIKAKYMKGGGTMGGTRYVRGVSFTPSGRVRGAGGNGGSGG